MENNTISDSEKKIFDLYGHYFVDEVFRDAANDFGFKNLNRIVDTEVNNQENIKVHDEYKQFVCNFIEPKMKEQNGVTQEEITAFNESIKTPGKLDQFKSIDNDTVDQLYDL